MKLNFDPKKLVCKFVETGAITVLVRTQRMGRPRKDGTVYIHRNNAQACRDWRARTGYKSHHGKARQ